MHSATKHRYYARGYTGEKVSDVLVVENVVTWTGIRPPGCAVNPMRTRRRSFSIRPPSPRPSAQLTTSMLISKFLQMVTPPPQFNLRGARGRGFRVRAQNAALHLHAVKSLEP